MKNRALLTVLKEDLLYSGHLTAAAAVGISLTASMIMKVPVSILVIALVYLGTYTIYFYNRKKEIWSDENSNPDRTKHFKTYYQKQANQILNILIGILLAGAFVGGWVVFFSTVFLFGCGIIYTATIKKLTNNIPGLKSFFTPFVWALIVPFSVINSTDLEMLVQKSVTMLLLIAFVFLRMFVSSNFFDFKDITQDKKEDIKTLSVLLGRVKMLKLLKVINIASVLPIFFGVLSERMPIESLGLLFALPYAYFYLVATANVGGANLSRVSYVLTDGEKIMWPVSVFMAMLIR